jgi:GntR family transcriptional regulator
LDRSPSDIPISIDSNSGIPLWLQLRNRLTYLITSGHFRCGDRLPTVRNLAVELGINFNTVSKVYRDIERDGYIVSRQGAGTFVSDEYRHREGAALNDTDLLIDEFIRECLELGVPKDDIAGLVIERLMNRDDSEGGQQR